jgi:ribosome-associated protein
MWIDLVLLTGATGDELALIRGKLASRLDAGGRLMVSSQATRDQGRNLEDAAARAADLIRAALVRPKVRRPTKPTGASRERRIEAKRRRAGRLRHRRIDLE